MFIDCYLFHIDPDECLSYNGFMLIIGSLGVLGNLMMNWPINHRNNLHDLIQFRYSTNSGHCEVLGY
ncbi:hypothetical protein HanIR_Chr16g0816281 [Helianthus annuus]|nr:hypothetical protein HanIR_Chr16g0816281 [Helianthus annuus]